MGGWDGGYMDDVTEDGEDGLVGELPTLNTARYGAACGAVGQVRRVECSTILIIVTIQLWIICEITIEFHSTACLHISPPLE